VLHALLRLVSRLSAEQPLVLVVDDAQWGDVPSLRFLGFLARRIQPLSVALVVGGRPAVEWPKRELHDAVLCANAARILRPRPLSRPASDAIFAAALQQGADARHASDPEHPQRTSAAPAAGAAAAGAPAGGAPAAGAPAAGASAVGAAAAGTPAAGANAAGASAVGAPEAGAPAAAAPAAGAPIAIAPAFAEAAYVASGGNPFYLRELGRAVGERQLDPSADNAAEVARLGPAAVRGAVAARLRSLPAPALAFADAAAVLGERSSRGLVAELAGLDPADAALVERRLREIGLLDDGPEPRFAHPILRATVRDLQPFLARARRHARAAELLRAHGAPVSHVAAQLLHTAPAGDQEAVATLRAAAREAINRGAPEIAAHHLRRALAEPPTERERAALTLELGLAEAQQRSPSARATLIRAIELNERPDERLRAALVLWTSDSFDGRYAEGFRVLEQTLKRSAGATPGLLRRVELEVSRALRSTRATAAEGRARIADLRAGLDFDRARTTLNDRLAFALVALDDFYTNAPADGLVALAERCLPLTAAQIAHDESQLLHIPLYALIFCDRLERAGELLDELVADATRQGSMIGVEIGLVWRALAHLRAGSLAAAETDARSVLDAVGESRWRFGAAASRVWLAEVALDRGDVRAASELHAPVLSVAEISGRAWMHDVRLTQARILTAAHDPRGAFDVLLGIGRSELEFAATRPSSLPWRSHAAIAAAALGEVATARRLATEELELTRLFGAPRAIGVALRARGLITPGPEGRAALEEAVELLASSPARLEHARALIDLGERVAGDGDPLAAADRLRAGLDGAVACGAHALEQRARVALGTIS
jgi:hypothetical protein